MKRTETRPTLALAFQFTINARFAFFMSPASGRGTKIYIYIYASVIVQQILWYILIPNRMQYLWSKFYFQFPSVTGSLSKKNKYKLFTLQCIHEETHSQTSRIHSPRGRKIVSQAPCPRYIYREKQPRIFENPRGLRSRARAAKIRRGAALLRVHSYIIHTALRFSVPVNIYARRQLLRRVLFFFFLRGVPPAFS